jgi:predicted dehydrogenase
MRTRFAQVGLGARSWLYSIAIVNQFPERNELVGVCDRNAGRLEQRLGWARANGLAIPGRPAEEFDRLLEEARPDCVIVTTDDVHHDHYVARALDAGCDVLCEKPLAIDAERCARVLDAQARTGRRLGVTFNYRFSPARAKVKELLAAGAIGDVLSVDFHWLLDTNHGADYFRRWHRRRASSGGLLVHKATHHFDLVNWWLGSSPERVFASGRRAFYGPERAAALGLARPGERCLDCAEAGRCPFRLDLRARPELAAIYLEHERHDGYLRDRCVFSEEIDIEDAAAAVVEYASGARLAYSLHAFMPWEGYTVAFNGTRGRLEHHCEEASYVSGDGTAPGALRPDRTWIRVHPHFGAAYDVPLGAAAGGHGGGDALLVAELFGEPGPDPLGRRADHRAGAWSVLVGVAANCSIASGEPVRVLDLLPPATAARLRAGGPAR